jgi:hypothetical protein
LRIQLSLSLDSTLDFADRQDADKEILRRNRFDPINQIGIALAERLAQLRKDHEITRFCSFARAARKSDRPHDVIMRNR